MGLEQNISSCELRLFFINIAKMIMPRVVWQRQVMIKFSQR